MNFLAVVVFSLGILISCSSARSTFDSLEGEETKAAVDTVTLFKLRVKDGDQDYEGEITINKDQQTETMHFEAHGQSVEADIVFDFKRDLVMYRVPAKNLCFLGPLDEDAPQPDQLAEELEREEKNPANVHAARPITKWNAKSLLEARFVLTDEMTKLCADYPIYVLEKDVNQVNVNQVNQAKEIYLSRVKRQWSFGKISIRTPPIDVDIDFGFSFGKRRR